MNMAPADIAQLTNEHHALMRHCAQAQTRCSDLVRQQAAEIEDLRAQLMRQRAALIARDTALAWEREDRAALEAAVPGLPRRIVLARRVEALVCRVQDLMRERLHWQKRAAPEQCIAVAASSQDTAVEPPDLTQPDVPGEEIASLEASLVAADLVICQTGCLSHGAYWRVQDHCKRSGKTCVLVDQPDAVRIVRIHKSTVPDVTAGVTHMSERILHDAGT